jgi:hypothetical protein
MTNQMALHNFSIGLPGLVMRKSYIAGIEVPTLIVNRQGSVVLILPGGVDSDISYEWFPERGLDGDKARIDKVMLMQNTGVRVKWIGSHANTNTITVSEASQDCPNIEAKFTENIAIVRLGHKPSAVINAMIAAIEKQPLCLNESNVGYCVIKSLGLRYASMHDISRLDQVCETTCTARFARLFRLCGLDAIRKWDEPGLEITFDNWEEQAPYFLAIALEMEEVGY